MCLLPMEAAEIGLFAHSVVTADLFYRDWAQRGLKPIWQRQMEELALEDLVGRGIGLPKM